MLHLLGLRYPQISHDDASVASGATHRSNVESLGDRLREMARYHAAQVANLVNDMAVDVDGSMGDHAVVNINPHNANINFRNANVIHQHGGVIHETSGILFENGRPYDNVRRQSLAQSQIAHISNLSSEASRRRNLAQSQVTHVANVARAMLKIAMNTSDLLLKSWQSLSKNMNGESSHNSKFFE